MNNFKYGVYLLEVLPKHIKKINLVKNELSITVEPSSLCFILTFLEKHFRAHFKVLTAITAVDYPQNEKRFEVVYLLLSLHLNFRIKVKTLTNETGLIPSVFKIHNSAIWYEREVWDMFGIFFSDHPDLRRILTDYGFEGFPLRKDFPQTGYLEVRYDDEKKYVIYEPLEITQEYRVFNYNSSWKQVK